MFDFNNINLETLAALPCQILFYGGIYLSILNFQRNSLTHHLYTHKASPQVADLVITAQYKDSERPLKAEDQNEKSAISISGSGKIW